MKLIKRHSYLDRLRDVRGTPDIKIIVGVRRGGKSKLLEAFKELLSSESGVNVIYIDLSDLANEGLLEYHALNDYVLSNTKDGVENVLMIDEVQECKGFERELAPFAKIRDAYPRMLIARTRNPETDFEGIRIVNLADWLSGVSE